MKRALIAALLCATVSVAVAQQFPAATAKTPVAGRKSAAPGSRSECVAIVGLCVSVPSAWQRLGDIFDGLGFVVAEPRTGQGSESWPQITVAAIDVPAKKDTNGTEVAVSLDSLVETELIPDGSFTAAETLERSRLLVNGANAEIVRARLHDADGNQSMEAAALIEGEDGLVYSIALRCAPEDFDRLAPVFDRSLHSWRVKPLAAAPSSQPKQDTKKK